eukprot:7835429-Ditylum_brightwellii.AAC.1
MRQLQTSQHFMNKECLLWSWPKPLGRSSDSNQAESDNLGEDLLLFVRLDLATLEAEPLSMNLSVSPLS